MPHGSVSRIGLSRPTNGWRTGVAPGATKCLSGQFVSRALQARVGLQACVSSPDMSGEPSWSVTDELKWRLSKAAQQLQIPLIFVSGVTARDELVQKCLCLEVRHESHNVEQSLRRVTEQDDLTFCGDSFETLDQCAFAAEVMALGEVAECAASHTVWAKDTSDSITNGSYLGEEATMRPLRAGVSHGESADDSDLCSYDRDSEYGDEIAQGKK